MTRPSRASIAASKAMHRQFRLGARPRWSEAEEDELQRLVARGLSWETIGMLLRRRGDAVRRHALLMEIHHPAERQVRAVVTRREDLRQTPEESTPPGVPISRDAAFVAALVREALRLGLITIRVAA